MAYFCEIVLIIFPIAVVCLFGFSRAFKNGSFFRGLFCGLPFIIFQLFVLMGFFSVALRNPDTNWQSRYMIVYSVVSMFGVGLREECIYRATLQNIIAKKHANSVKGVWTTVILGALMFGMCHFSNIFFNVDPLAVLIQMFYATVAGLLFGAIYLRSGNLWALIFIHTLTDVAGFADSNFILHVSDVEVMSNTSVSWRSLAFRLIYVGITIFLLRPSKCKEIYQNLCFASKDSEENAPA